MSQPLTITAGGPDPFVYTFWIGAIITGCVLLGATPVLTFPGTVVEWMMSFRRTDKSKKEELGLLWMQRFLSGLILFGMSVALPSIATHFFYQARTQPYASDKNYRDTWWIVTLWMYSAGAICISCGIWLNLFFSDAYKNWKAFSSIATWIILMLVLVGTPIAGMAINANEMYLNVGSPTSVMFIINGILLVLYMTMEWAMLDNRENRAHEAAEKVILTGVQLSLPNVSETLSSSTMVHLKPCEHQDMVVNANSDAHLALAEAEKFKSSSLENNSRFESGYALRAVNHNGTDNVYMLSPSAAKLFDTLTLPQSAALVHQKNFESDNVDVLQIKSDGPMSNLLGAARKANLRVTNLYTKSRKYQEDVSFLGITNGWVYHMVTEENTIVLYSLYMFSVILLTLRCSPTALVAWTIMHGLPMLMALSPSPVVKPELVDRREQWAHLQMFFGSVALSLFGLTYKIFPALSFNDYYVTAVNIWQFANTGNNFWYTGISGNTYNGIEIVSIVQLSVFGFTAYFVLTLILTVFSYFDYKVKQ